MTRKEEFLNDIETAKKENKSIVVNIEFTTKYIIKNTYEPGSTFVLKSMINDCFDNDLVSNEQKIKIISWEIEEY